MNDQPKRIRPPSLVDALIPLVFMIIMLTWSVILFGIDAASGPLQVALLLIYFPYCFFNFLNPLIGLVYGFVGINVQHLAEEDHPALESLPQAPLVDQQK